MIRPAACPVLRWRWRLRPPAPSCPPARAAGGIEVKRSQGRRAVPLSHLRSTPGRPDAGSAVRKRPAVTNRDKKDSIRGRMADAGEPFNVARRKVEAAAAGPVPEAEFQEIKRTGRYDLSNRELTALPPEIAQLANLRELKLGGNRLTTLPPEIGQLTNLRRLALGGNRLTALPPGDRPAHQPRHAAARGQSAHRAAPRDRPAHQPPEAGARRQPAHHATAGACRSTERRGGAWPGRQSAPGTHS